MPQLIVNPETRTLRELLGNSVEYKVPSFQRDYAWGPEEWADLWDDISALEDGTQHYMGYVVLKEEAARQLVIVDGQQRIATLCILALAVVHSLNEGNGEERRNYILDNYLKTRSAADLIPRSRLVLNRINAPFYQQYLLEGQPISSVRREHLSNQKMHRAFLYFKGQLAVKFGDASSDAEIAEFFDRRVGDGLLFTALRVQDHESAFVIFETLNARGVELSSPDLLKNHLFSIVHEADPSEHTLRQIEERWQQASENLRSENMTTFLKHYWNSRRGTLVRKKNLYRAVRRELKTADDVFPFLRDMNDVSDLYARLRKPETGDWDPEQRKYLSRLALYPVSQHIPLLFAAYRAWGSNREFTALARVCSVLAFRWVVIGGLNPSDLEAAFAKAIAAVRRGDARRASDLLPLLQSIYLSDERFTESFAELAISTRNKKELAKHILLELERQRSGVDHSGDSTVYALEHVFPENPEDGWESFDQRDRDLFLWRLGNLTPLESKPNRRAGNRPFEEKRVIYEASCFQLTQECAECEEWTPVAIHQRQRRLAKTASAIWRLEFPPVERG